MTDFDKKDTETKEELRGIHRAVPVILTAIALFIALCFFMKDTGTVGKWMSNLLLGLFSGGAFAIPPLLVIHAVFYLSDLEKKRLVSRIIFSAITLISISCVIFAIHNFGVDPLPFDIGNYYKNGKELSGGGFIGSIIAFCLIKIFGSVGLLVIALMVFALYITFFFSKEKNAFVYLGLKCLTALAVLASKMESGIKSFARRKADRKAKRAEEAKKERNRELYEDEFFDVDNGLEALEIEKLGILETRSRESIEANPKLAEHVIHEEELNKTKNRNTTKESAASGTEDAPIHKKRVVDITGDLRDTTEVPQTDENAIVYEQNSAFVRTETTAPAMTTDRSADSVFTEDFDPFDIERNRRLANKPSSSAVTIRRNEVGGIGESIDNLTEEDIAKAKRQADFEKKKAELIAKSRAANAGNSANVTQRQNADAAKESTEKCVSFREGKSEDHRIGGNFTFTTTIEKPAEDTRSGHSFEFGIPECDRETAMNVTLGDPFPRAKGGFVFETAPSAQSAKSSFLFEPAGSAPVESLDNASAKSIYEEIKRASAMESTAAPSAGRDAFTPQENQKNGNTAAIPSEDRKQEEYAAANDYTPIITEFNTASPERTEIKSPLPFPKNEEASRKVKTDEPKTERIEVTREILTPPTVVEEIEVAEENEEETAFAVEDVPGSTAYEPLEQEQEEDEDEDVSAFDSDEEAPEEEQGAEVLSEIPPEKQNPEVIAQRGLFDFLREEDNARAQAEEDTEEEEISQSDAITDSFMEGSSAIDTFSSEDENVPNDEEQDDDAYGGVINRDDDPPFENARPASSKFAEYMNSMQRANEEKQKQKEPKEEEKPPRELPDYSDYKFPPIDMLISGGTEEDDDSKPEIQENAEKLIDTLASFRVSASIKGIDRGPRITRYEVVPARGVKVSSVTSLFDDISLALAAPGIRMEAPIPGKSAIGFEIPNKKPSTVYLRDLIESGEFMSSNSKTFVCIGKDVTGNPVFGDIAKMPHVLVAGATGMGKSVCINSIMISMLFRARPDEVKFIMVDPKKVEFNGYNGIPHLLIPVVTDPKQAAGALMWAVEEMEKRFDLIEKARVKKIDDYNAKVRDNPELGAPMSKIVIVIDELNDLMVQVRDPVENLIMRIAQKARAAGIHLIIGTQRPSVNVITGVIKANIPSRISCKVSSNTDSRTILEQGGAEKLLNNGDMLFWPVGKPKSIRVQGAFVSDTEVENVMDYLRAQAKGDIYDGDVLDEINRAASKCSKQKDDDIDEDDGDSESMGDGYLNDQKFLDAVNIALNAGKVSTSLLQRRVGLGYGRAAKYIDIMEDLGVVSEKNGQKPRDVLITKAEWNEMLSRRELT